MRDTKSALIWITDILKKHNIPYQITGGLAAKVYGSTRQLEDIDIDIPEDKFDLIKDEVKEFIIFGPEKFKSDKWDLLLMTLNYYGQEIDLGGAHFTKIFNQKTGKWQILAENFTNAVIKNIYGIEVPFISRDDLIYYKKILSRDVDLMDVKEIENNKS